MRVAIVDDQVLLREGLARLLAEAGMDVVASEGDIDGFLGAADASHPDVAILDIRLPPTFTDEGLRAADLLRTRHPGTAILVLSQYLDAGYAFRLLNPSRAGSATCSRTECPRSRYSSTRLSEWWRVNASWTLAS